VALRDDLRVEVCRPQLRGHPLLGMLPYLDPKALRTLCTKAVDWLYPRIHDELFCIGNTAQSAYLLVSGELWYSQPRDKSGGEITTVVSPGAWLSESAFWSQWKHVGTATAAVDSQVMTVDGEALAEILLKARRGMSSIAASYGSMFHQCIVKAIPPAAAFPNDLEVPFTDFGDIVRTMAPDVRVVVAEATLAMLEAGSGAWRFPGLSRAIDAEMAQALRGEVHAGKSVIVLGRGGGVERVVSLVVLELKDSDDRLLVQVGSVGEDGLKTDCRLPAEKLREGEMGGEAYERLLARKLCLASETVELQHTVERVTQKESDRYGIKTKYLRKVYTARFSGSLNSELVDVCAEVADRTERDPPRVQGDGRHMVVDGNTTRIYTWLEERDFEHLASPAGAADLEALLSNIAPKRRCI